MARTYKLGTIVGWILVAVAAVYAVAAIFGEAIYDWIKSLVTSKTLAVAIFRVLALLLISSIVALAKELNNWRITFHPRLRIWREAKANE